MDEMNSFHISFSQNHRTAFLMHLEVESAVYQKQDAILLIKRYCISDRKNPTAWLQEHISHTQKK